jgi:hypothetical protein
VAKKHRLIISEEKHGPYPVLSKARKNTPILTLVVNWKGTWEPEDSPERYLVVEPGDKLELVLSAENKKGGSLWLLKRELPLFLPTEKTERQEAWERMDVESGSRILQVNRTLARDAGESRYALRVSAMRMKPRPPVPIVGQGQPGSLTASKP